ncbi:MAG: glutaredoxin family protein [Acidobacteriia bacterium]|nr:glutaredoxin family protein [Terriglobia bacterium]
MSKLLVFTQRGCLSCELLKVYLEARGIAFEERDISADPAARTEMLEKLDSNTTPTLVVFSGEQAEVVVGFDPERLDQLLAETPSSDAVIES